MNMFRHLLTTTLSLLLAPFLPAQEQATTLLAAAQQADVVVHATVLAATDPSPDFHRLQFQSTQVLKGTTGAQFVLLEPSGACCGRVLFSLQPGDRCLLFLRRQGATLHPFGGGRGVLPANAQLLAHVAALLAAPDDAARAALLADQLAADEPRIAADAAHALAALPNLALSDAHRTAVTAALRSSLEHGTTTAASLCEVAARLADPQALDTLLPSYLQARRGDQGALLRRALLRCPPADLVARLPQFSDADATTSVRAAELLVALPPEHGHAALQQLLQRAPHPRVQLCLCESLLQNGARGAELAGQIPDSVRRLAERRVNSPRSFRAIQPGRR